MHDHHLREITLRGVLLGVLITMIFTTANVYLGLKVGLTFASSIPAVVLSVAIFRILGKSNILENNIIQTQVSAAGTLSAVVFIIPALFFIGYWHRFDFWHTFLICSCGGILGVLFTIPFRNELVKKNSLPYPEGRAAAEVLKAAQEQKSNNTGIKEIFFGASLSSLSIFLSQGLKLTSDGFGIFFHFGKAIFQIPIGFSLALIGAGWLVGLSVGFAILLGIVLAWGVLAPILSTQSTDLALLFGSGAPIPHELLEKIGMQIWQDQVRFIGVGMIGISAVWTLVKMLKPTFIGLKNSFVLSMDPRDQDLPFKWILGIFLFIMACLFATFDQFVADSKLPANLSWIFVLVMGLCSVCVGFLISATCGYMAGLVGSSSSPISGIGIIGVALLSLIVLGLGKIFALDLLDSKFFVALALFSTSIVIAIATIANDNLQDLKTGQIVGATPWKQEVILMVGCIVGASVIAPVLNLLYEAYGFVGHLPREGMSPSNALSAPQAILMTSITQGIFDDTLNWTYIKIGALLGLGFILLDLWSQRKYSLSLPPLAIGMGVYLPPIVTIPIFFGSLLAYLAGKGVCQEHRGAFQRRGILLASGLIVGESLMGIVIAALIVFSIHNGGNGELLSLTLNQRLIEILGTVFFLIALGLIYRHSHKDH